MRIIAGEWRGRRLVAPKGGETRPTADRTRETLFSMLASRLGDFAELQVADLFAGSGALGLEALSRGAASVSFIEKAESSLKVLQHNLGKARAADRTRIIRRDALKPGRATLAHDLVLMDPPYGQDLAAPALLAVARDGWLAAGAVIVVETDGTDPFDWPEGFTVLDRRKHGRATLHFGQAA